MEPKSRLMLLASPLTRFFAGQLRQTADLLEMSSSLTTSDEVASLKALIAAMISVLSIIPFFPSFVVTKSRR